MVLITIPVVKIYVVLQVSVCAGVNNMTMWASVLCGVTAAPIYILVHYVMIRCKGKQVLRARSNVFRHHQLLHLNRFESFLGNEQLLSYEIHRFMSAYVTARLFTLS